MSMSEVASCSYEARDAGVRSGMFLGRAKQLCPNLVAIPYEFESYSEVSKILYDTVARLVCWEVTPEVTAFCNARRDCDSVTSTLCLCRTGHVGCSTDM